MSTILQAHGKNFITRLEHGKIHCGIGLATGVRLDICMFSSEDLLGSFNSEVFRDIHMLTATVISLGWISFCVLISKYTACDFNDCGKGKVFRGNQFNMRALPYFFVGNGLMNSRVDFSEGTGIEEGWRKSGGTFGDHYYYFIKVRGFSQPSLKGKGWILSCHPDKHGILQGFGRRDRVILCFLPR